MSIFTKSIKVAVAALAIGSTTLAPIAAEAYTPRPGHHGGGHTGGGHHGGGHHGGGHWGGHHGGRGGWDPRWGHGGGWGGRWNHGVYPIIYNGGDIRRCKIVERVDVYGDVIGTRRVCRSAY